MKNSIQKAFISFGFWTAISRVFGFIRDILLAATLGAGPVSDAFFIAFKFLNPSILKALAPPIIEAFAEAKTKEGLSSGPLGTGWHEAISDFLKLFKIILFFLFIN